MRALIVLAISSLLLVPVSIAQDGDPPQSPEDCRERDNPDACKERYCKANPDECRDAAQRPDKERMPPERPCDADCVVELKHISFEIDREGRALREYALAGHILFETIQLRVDGPLEIKRHSNQIDISGYESRLRLQDNPTANIGFKAESGALVLTLPDDAIVSEGENGLKIAYGDVVARLISEEFAVDGQTIVVEEFMAFHVPANYRRDTDRQDNERDDEERDQADRDDEERDDKIRDAIEKRKLGAEVRIRPDDDDTDDDDVQITGYDDVDVQVQAPKKATRDDPVLVTVSANLTEGRTFVVDLDPAMLAGPDLEVRYFDILDDGNKTEVVFRMADSLQDILDADDDAGQPEYWVVRDANGFQLLASVPYWSVHQISIASIGEFVTQPSVLIGIGAGIGGVAVAAIVLLRPRRSGV